MKRIAHTRLVAAVLYGLAMTGALTAPKAAHADDLRGWTLRGVLGAGHSTGGELTLESGDPSAYVQTVIWELGQGFGGGFNAEFRMNNRLGVQFDLMWTTYASDLSIHTVDDKQTTIDDRFNQYPLMAGLNIHLTSPKSRFDFYVAPMAGWINNAALAMTDDGIDGLSVKDDFGFGVMAGVDLLQGQDGLWFWNATVRWLYTGPRIEVTAEDGTSTIVDYKQNPLMITLGAGFRLF